MIVWTLLGLGALASVVEIFRACEARQMLDAGVSERAEDGAACPGRGLSEEKP